LKSLSDFSVDIQEVMWTHYVEAWSSSAKILEERSHGLFKVLLQSLIGCGRGTSTACINNCCVLFSDIVVFNLEVTLTVTLKPLYA
jgi:hypothetical protein